MTTGQHLAQRGAEPSTPASPSTFARSPSPHAVASLELDVFSSTADGPQLQRSADGPHYRAPLGGGRSRTGGDHPPLSTNHHRRDPAGQILQKLAQNSDPRGRCSGGGAHAWSDNPRYGPRCAACGLLAPSDEDVRTERVPINWNRSIVPTSTRLTPRPELSGPTRVGDDRVWPTGRVDEGYYAEALPAEREERPRSELARLGEAARRRGERFVDADGFDWASGLRVEVAAEQTATVEGNGPTEVGALPEVGALVNGSGVGALSACDVDADVGALPVGGVGAPPGKGSGPDVGAQPGVGALGDDAGVGALGAEITRWLATAGVGALGVTCPEALSALELPNTRAAQMRVSAAFKALGYVRRQLQRNSVREWRYFPPGEPEVGP